MKIKKVVFGFIAILLFVTITIIFSLFDAGFGWEKLNIEFSWGAYISLVIYRLLIYFLPGFLLWLINKNECLRIKCSIIDFYTIQFIAYTIVKLTWEFLALDYIFSNEILDRIDTSVVVVSLFLSLILKKKVKIDPEIIKEK